jgi:3-isopropylmalate/(R)-2-methylmalate dehydratase small subunit
VLPAPLHATLMQIAKEDLAATVTINLAAATMTTPDGATHSFPIDRFSQKMLLDGLDELDYIRTQGEKILAHETAHPGTINTLQPNAPR